MPVLTASVLSPIPASSNPPSLLRCFLTKVSLPRLLVIVLMIFTLTGCSTRQLNESISGSTAQRLVTYSLEKFIRDLMNQTELSPLRDKRVKLNVHFVEGHTLLDYATRLLSYQLQLKYRAELTERQPADYDVSIFFNSLATDYDSYGLSLPGFGLTATPDSRINILSIDMFHGVTEGYAVIRNNATSTTDRTQRLLARVRADNVATPILDFPVNQLDRE